MQTVLLDFAREHIVPILILTAWYLLATTLNALFAKKTTIEAWCQERPTLALILHVTRKAGFDVWGMLDVFRAYAKARAGLPASVPPPADSTIKTTLPALLLIGSLAASAVQSGCSLEAARQARVNSQLRAGTYSAPAQARPDAECKALDNVHVYTAYGAEVSLGVGTAAGVLAAADTSTKVENAAIGTGIGAAVVAAGLGYWSQKSGAIWTEQCSQ